MRRREGKKKKENSNLELYMGIKRKSLYSNCDTQRKMRQAVNEQQAISRASPFLVRLGGLKLGCPDCRLTIFRFIVI